MSRTDDGRGHFRIPIHGEHVIGGTVGHGFDWPQIRDWCRVLDPVHRVPHLFDPRLRSSSSAAGHLIPGQSAGIRVRVPVPGDVVLHGIHFTDCQLHGRVLDPVLLIIVVIVIAAQVIDLFGFDARLQLIPDGLESAD